MIGITLGLVILMALYSMLVSNRQSYSSIRTSTELMSTGQQVSQLVTTLVQQAGFRNYARIKNSTYLPTETITIAGTSIAWSEKQSTYISNDVATGNADIKTSTDAVFVHFTGSSYGDSIPDDIRTAMKPVPSAADADGTIINCNGDSVTNSSMTIAIFVSPDNKLKCFDSSGNKTVIAENIENMQVRVKTTTSNSEYQVATGTTDWPTISNIELGFLLSKQYDASIQYSSNTIKLLDKDISVTNKSNLMQTIISNVMLRNTPSS
jgi:Tfp pilus assembly protein PilW